MKKTDKCVIMLRIGLENCEEIIVDADDVELISLNNVSYNEGILRGDKQFYKYKVVHDLFMELKPSADIKYQSFGRMSSETVFQRLQQFSDIVDITLVMQTSDGDTIEEQYNTYWPDTSSDECNELQHSEMQMNGNLRIKVG